MQVQQAKIEPEDPIKRKHIIDSKQGAEGDKEQFEVDQRTTFERINQMRVNGSNIYYIFYSFISLLNLINIYSCTWKKNCEADYIPRFLLKTSF